MRAITQRQPIDYLAIGHISCDITPDGLKLGGTVSYAALTALALGKNVGIVTSWGEEIDLDGLKQIAISNEPTAKSTTFENNYTPTGRVQILHHRATPITQQMIPAGWENTPIIHIGPIANETEPTLVHEFPNSFVGITPQGWLRTWDQSGHVFSSKWNLGDEILQTANATVLSIEDLAGDEKQIEVLADASQVLVITEGANGARVYWNGDVRRFTAPQVLEADATGAGDIFATAFFIQFHKTRDPYEAAKFANRLASQSITRSGLASVPTDQEVKNAIVEVI